MTSTLAVTFIICWLGLLIATGGTAVRLCPVTLRPTQAWTPVLGLAAAFITVYVFGFSLLAWAR